MRIHPARVAIIGLLLGITGGAVWAGPVAKKVNPRPYRINHSCEAKPNEDKCLAPFFLDDCGSKWREECRQYFNFELEAHYNANPAPVVTMFKPKAHNIPVGLRDGKTNEYPGPKNKRTMVGTFTKLGTTKVVPRKGAKPSIKPVPAAAQRPNTFDSAVTTRMGGGKRRPFELSKAKYAGPMRLMTSDNIFARTGLTRPPHTGLGMLPVNAHRMPAWDANGGRVVSCEEYGYEKMYDWARYTDAVAACAGDLHCQLDIAFLPATPGIADRTLRAKDGTPLGTQINVTTGQKLPKNDFFIAASKFVYAGSGDKPLEPTPKLDALAAALEAGKEYYHIGGGTYSSEWDFHRKLHDANRTVTQAEFEEYELRKERFRVLLQKWQWAAAAEEAKLKGNWKAVHQWVSPIDMVGNPFERFEVLSKKTRRLAKGAASLRKQGLVDARGLLTDKGKAALAKNRAKTERSFVKVKPGTKRGASNPKGKATPNAAAVPKANTNTNTPKATTTTPGTNAPKTMGPAGTPRPPRGMNKLPGTTGSVQPTALMGFVPKGNSPAKQSSQNKGSASQIAPQPCDPKNFPHVREMFGMGPLSCQLGQMLRQEWARKQQGYKSCLDLDNDDCDWSPMLFEARFTKGLPYIAEQGRNEEYCLDWTFDAIDSSTLAAAKQYIDGQKQIIEGELEKLKPYQAEKGSTKKFGKEWVDGDHFGDKDMFAAGYDYDLGWDIGVATEQPGAVCELGAGARGGFGVDGWFIGNSFEVVDGRAQFDWNRLGDKVGNLDIHLRVFSADVFDPVAGQFEGSWDEPLFTGGIDIPSGYKPSFTVMAGPVPITGAVWGEFFYGAKFAIGAVSEAPNCDMTKMRFGVNTAFTPELGLNAKAQVGVGISGLLSAGVRGMVNLVTVGVPVTTTFAVTNEEVAGGKLQASLGFDLDVRLSLATLSGWLAVYIELLFFEEEFVIFRWAGLGPESISLLGEPLHADLPLGIMAK